jgi:RimJ/RimL family protein N-acetyltransferase
MNQSPSITLREIAPADLEIFFVQQLDPEANRMAAFVGKDPTDKAAFAAHWDRILSAPQITQRTILVGGQIAGHIACYPQDGNKEVTYWLGREFWGRGIATAALNQLLQLVADRPLFARAATDNIGSLRVLAKCGFQIIGGNRDFAHGRGADTEEYILRLDHTQAKA